MGTQPKDYRDAWNKRINFQGASGPIVPKPSYDPTPSSQGVVTAMPGGGITTSRVNVPEGYRSDIFGHVTGVNPNGSPRLPVTPKPPGAPTGPGGSGGGGGGGGGGGAAPVDLTSILGLLNRKPQQQTWQNLDFQEYVPTAYRDFNSKAYDTMRSGLTDAITADRAAGNAQYAQLGQEMANYQNPWATPTSIQNPAMSASMQRMMQANGTPTNTNQTDINQGVQADQAFGNLGSMLGVIAGQEQQSRQLANQGYQRNLNERLDAEQRGGMLGVNMSETKARELYEQEKWQFGEQVAQQNYQNRMANNQYNNQGQNTTNASNVTAGNDWSSAGIKTIIDAL